MESSLPSLVKSTSTVVTSCHNTESTVIHAPLRKVWEHLRNFDLHKLIPKSITNIELQTGALRVGETVKVTFADGSLWTLKVLEISELHHLVSWEVIDSHPALSVTSIVSTIKLQRVTDDNTTFLSWETDFSNDADATVIQDNKYKKLEYFIQIKSVFGKTA